jgi:hypothetical protein
MGAAVEIKAVLTGSNLLPALAAEGFKKGHQVRLCRRIEKEGRDMRVEVRAWLAAFSIELQHSIKRLINIVSLPFV